jgi:hypothetical protein
MHRDHPPWYFLFHALGHTGTIVFLSLALIAVLAIRYWPPLASRVERWWVGRR